MNNAKLIDCTNYFNDIGRQRLRDALESGIRIQIHIDCIGHSASIREAYIYDEWLKETYGERLVCEDGEYGSTIYFLK